MICPVCKYDMIVVEYRNIELDYCNSCRGVWFDSGELELLLKSYGLEEPKAFFDGIFNSQEAASPEKKRNCPICALKMKKTSIGLSMPCHARSLLDLLSQARMALRNGEWSFAHAHLKIINLRLWVLFLPSALPPPSALPLFLLPAVKGLPLAANPGPGLSLLRWRL